MSNITWNGLCIEGTVTHDAGVWTFSNGDPGYPGSTDVEIGDITVDDEEEFAAFLEEHEKPSDWKTLPEEAKDWILAKYDETICEKLADQ